MSFPTLTFEAETIEQWITPKSKVLDLGCGKGVLLSHLKQTQNITATGVEIDYDHITTAIEAGLDVVEQNIDDGLNLFRDNSFDTVVMTQTLQAIKYPDLALDEMLRVGQEGIVTFPNFAYWRCRWHLSMRGQMPVSEFMPYSWYDTPNIHFCTIRDFENLCAKKSIRILDKKFSSATNTHSSSINNKLANIAPNLFASSALYRISR